MAKVQRICQLCGNEFLVLESWLARDTTRGKFCSKECAKQNQKQKSERVVGCLECGKEFTTQQGLINRGQGKFCSHSCSASHSNRVRSEHPSQERLEQLYVQEKRSMQEIADVFGCSPNKVVYWMDQYGIARRDQSEAT